MKLNIEELAWESGNIAAVEVQLANSNGAWASWNELRDKAFARLIVERCAAALDGTGNDHCAAAIRNLMEAMK